MTHPVAAHLEPEDIEPVPTVPELAKKGLARVVVAGKTAETSTYSVSPEGYELIHAVMARNAARRRAKL